MHLRSMHFALSKFYLNEKIHTHTDIHTPEGGGGVKRKKVRKGNQIILVSLFYKRK